LYNIDIGNWEDGISGGYTVRSFAVNDTYGRVQGTMLKNIFNIIDDPS
jgi:hypothetical protein